MSKPYIPTFDIIIRRSFDGKVEGERSWKLSAVGSYVDKLEDAIAFVANTAMDAYGLRTAASTQETGTAPDNSGECPVCGWPVGHCNVGCTANSHQRIKIGDRVRLAIGTNTMLPTDGWTVYKLPSPEWRSYGVKHDNGGDMSINAEYVVPV